MTGKPGTISPDEFTFLNNASTTYSVGGVVGVLLLLAKIGKICSRKAESLKHEFAGSPVAAAYSNYAATITKAVGKLDGKVATDDFNTLTGMIALYGVEPIVWKLAKIAKRANDRTNSALLSGLFPNSAKAAAPVAAARTGKAYPRF
jgi:hypothetical protein